MIVASDNAASVGGYAVAATSYAYLKHGAIAFVAGGGVFTVDAITNLYSIVPLATEVDTPGSLAFALLDAGGHAVGMIPEFVVPAMPQPLVLYADALLDRANAVETGLTPRQAWRLIAAALAGKVNVAAPTVTIRNTADTKNRITATTTADGSRTAVTYDVS